MPSTDRSAPSPRGTLARLRDKLGDSNESSNSLASSSNSDDPNADLSLRPTTSDGVGTKLRDKLRRRSVDNRVDTRRDSEDSGKRLSNLMSRSRRSKPKNAGPSDLDRQLSVDSNNANLGISGLSTSSLDLTGSGRSSLLTDGESENEGKPTRPPLSTHPSHTGYLTLSSPEISSQTQPVATASETLGRSETASTISIPQIVEPSETDTAAPAVPDPNSSAEKINEAVSLPRKTIGADTDSVKSAGSGAGLGGFFKSSNKRNSVNSETPEEPKQVDGIVHSASEESKSPAELTSAHIVKNQERPETPQNRGRPRVNTASLPQTPPNLTETPTTFVTPPTPTDPNAEFPRRRRIPAQPRQRTDTLSSTSSAESIKHRRSQSATIPSKLSQSVPAPLTPTIEETKTPGGTLTQPTSAAGFFSSVFSAAQKAADSLSSNINLANQKNKANTSRSIGEEGGEEVIPGTQSEPVAEGADGEKRQLAVETLGKGDLSFGDLGIADETASMASTTDLPLQNGNLHGSEANKKAEEEAAARAVSDAYEKPVAAVVSQATGPPRPVSIASNDRLTLTGEQSPPKPFPDADGIKRSGSVRSRVSGRRKPRHRDSNATTGTGTTIAAGLAASTTGLGNLSGNGPGHRLTGFAVASNKRNKDFHQLFRSVPEDDYLIEDYSAALQKEILLHGRLYVSEGHICFSSNIMGWVTNLVISFDEVVSVEKKSTALIFPNAIVISTLQARNVFASFVARDSTYELLIGIWKISHPNLKSSLNGVTLDDAGTGDKTEVADADGSEGESDSGSDDEVYDEDEEDDGGSFEGSGLAPSIAGSDIGDKTLSRKPSAQMLATTVAQANGVPKGLENADTAVAGAGVSSDFPGPATHSPSQCSDEHYDRPLIDTTIPAPLGKIYSMMYGPASGTFMRKWLVEDQKSRELNLPDDKIGLDNDHKTMMFDYIKPLSGSIGPKQTKCITTLNLLAFDLEKAVTIDVSTQNPDVPSGNVFTTKTRYCLTWAANNSTRLVANCTVEWTGKSWLKGPIEKGANDGQIEYVKALVAALNAAVTTKPPVKGTARKGKRKGKKEVFDAEEANAQRQASVSAEKATSNWGLFEPLHGVLSPLEPFLNSQVFIAVLLALLLYTWVNPPRRGGMSVAFPGYTSPERIAAYEEIWRREESNLWDWLDDRVGLDGIFVPSGDGQSKDRQKVLAAKNMGKRVEEARMSERQMDDAIRVTEERLSALKEAVAKKKSGKRKT